MDDWTDHGTIELWRMILAGAFGVIVGATSEISRYPPIAEPDLPGQRSEEAIA